MTSYENLGAYGLVGRCELPDIHAEGIWLKHKKSGARIALIPCGDENKVFNIVFRTPPEDSTGVAHIIEHTVLCGSEKYPLKDPFVELIKGSLNTFLNAMTYPDKTMYPVASTNDTDFRNLMKVYLDAVFRPNIYREQNIFRQEGWHYEMSAPDKPLMLNGVVFNEMKGAYSTPESVLERETMEALFPDNAYGVDSGGNPKFIPELTYEKYLDFHRRYYHPSNSYIILYGNMDVEDTLGFIDREYLSAYDYAGIDSYVRPQKPFDAPVVRTGSYPVSDEEPLTENAYLSYNVVTGNPLSMKEMITCEVLDYALLSAPGAPVKQALLDAGIGKAVYGSFVDGILQPYFSISAKNADEKRASEFENIIKDVLREQAEKGIDRDSLYAGLTTLEFQFREADYSSYPKGLMYSILMMDTWLYSDDAPFTALSRLDAMEELKAGIESGWFETFIKEKLLGNSHSALVILKPEKGLAKREEDSLNEELSLRKAAMTEEEIAETVRMTHALKEWQDEEETEEAIATLPVLKREEIGKEALKISNTEEILNLTDPDGCPADVKAVWHDAPTNGICYLDLCYDISRIAEEELPYAALLRAVLMNVRTKKRSYLELGNAINAETGGISCTITAYDDPHCETMYVPYFILRGKSFYSKLENMAGLFREIMTESLFDDAKRLKDIISQTRAGLEMSLQQAGNAAAALRGLSYSRGISAFGDLTGGIAFYRFIRDIEENYEGKQQEVREHLERAARQIFGRNNLLISCTCEETARELLKAEFGKCLTKETADTAAERVQTAPVGKKNEGFMTSGQVQFVTMTGNIKPAGFRFTGAMNVLQQILSYEYLWQNVRVKGGAYGCSASFKRNGDVIFSSYRDPQLANTRKIFEEIPAYLQEFSADEEQMTKYIIGTISGLDTPLTPSLKGAVSLRCYLQGVTQEELQKTRDEILNATEEDIRNLAGCVRSVLAEDNFCVIGAAARIEEEKSLFRNTEHLI